jgi:hypothetical protein
MKADFLAGRIGGRGKERAEFPVDVAQGGIVAQQRAVNLGQPLENVGTGGTVLTHLDEGADDKRGILTASGLLRTEASK